MRELQVAVIFTIPTTALTVVLLTLASFLTDLLQVMLEFLFECFLVLNLFVGDESHLRFEQLDCNHRLLE